MSDYAALQTVTANWKMVCERDANARRELDRQERRAEAAERDLAAAREEIQQLRAERRSGLVETEPGLWEKPR